MNNDYNKALIVYHKEDNDGVFSAALVKYYFEHQLKYSSNDYDFFSADYANLNEEWKSGRMKEWINIYENIVMVDISCNVVAAMKWLHEAFNHKFIWIDHHAAIIKQSVAENFDEIEGIRDSSRSAILNTWKFFFDPLDEMYSRRTEPELLRILSAWDSFTFKQEGYELDYAKRVNTGINYMCELDLDRVYYNVVDKIIQWNAGNVYASSFSNDTIISKAEEVGEIICKNEKIVSKNIIQNYGDMTWTINSDSHPRSACALFIQGATNSQMFESVKDYVSNGIVFKRLRNGSWCISLYNTNIDDTFNCGEYLKKKYNGGGHIGAAGCTITESQFKQCLKLHNI